MDPNMSPADILRMALEKEKDALRFYEEACAIVSHPAAKVTLQAMAEEERSHIRKIEEELDRFFYADN